MKISIDVHSLENKKWAGKEHYVNNLVKELSLIDSNNQYYLYLRKDIALNLPSNFKKRIIRFPNFLWHLAVSIDLLFVKSDFYFAPTSYIVSALKLFTPTIIVIHDLVSFIMPAKHNKKARILEKLFMGISCKRAKYVIAVSENTKKDLIKIFKIKSNKIIVIPEAPESRFHLVEDQNMIKKVLNKYDLPANFILSVGTLEPRKNLVRLIEAYRDLLNAGLTKHTLVIVGKKGWYFEEIFTKVKQLKLEKNIIFTGYIDDMDIHFLYNAASCFVYPSLYEGFGLPVLEAMSCGCPVITSDNSSLPEVAGGAAILINPNSSSEIKDKLYLVLSNVSLREKMRQAGLDRAKMFSWAHTAKKSLEVFNL